MIAPSQRVGGPSSNPAGNVGHATHASSESILLGWRRATTRQGIQPEICPLYARSIPSPLRPILNQSSRYGNTFLNVTHCSCCGTLVTKFPKKGRAPEGARREVCGGHSQTERAY